MLINNYLISLRLLYIDIKYLEIIVYILCFEINCYCNVEYVIINVINNFE